jgi:hypothetical protein
MIGRRVRTITVLQAGLRKTADYVRENREALQLQNPQLRGPDVAVDHPEPLWRGPRRPLKPQHAMFLAAVQNEHNLFGPVATHVVQQLPADPFRSTALEPRDQPAFRAKGVVSHTTSSPAEASDRIGGRLAWFCPVAKA